MRNVLILVAAALVAVVVVAFGASTEAAPPLTSVKVEKTAFQEGGVVTGEITINNNGKGEAMVHSLSDSLEVAFPNNMAPPPLPDGSTPNWLKIADVPIANPGSLPAKSTLVIPYTFDLCAAAAFEGANALRNVVVIDASEGGREGTLIARSDGFEPVPPADCPSLTIAKVDQDRNPQSGVGFDVTFPDGSVPSCTTDAAGLCEFPRVYSGDYVIGEPDPPPHYRFEGCEPDADSGTVAAEVTLTPGDDVTVTCTNLRLADLTIAKVDQDGNPQSGVDFDVTFPDESIQNCTTDGDGLCHFPDVAPGAYTVDEPVPPGGYRFDGCAPDGNAETDAAEVTLAPGDDVTLTCTNQGVADLAISKVDQDDNPQSGVVFTVTFPDSSVQSCTTDEAGECGFLGVPSGDYVINEPTPPGGYRFAGCEPDEDTDTLAAQVTLAPGDALTVTCTNEGPLPIALTVIAPPPPFVEPPLDPVPSVFSLVGYSTEGPIVAFESPLFSDLIPFGFPFLTSAGAVSCSQLAAVWECSMAVEYHPGTLVFVGEAPYTAKTENGLESNPATINFWTLINPENTDIGFVVTEFGFQGESFSLTPGCTTDDLVIYEFITPIQIGPSQCWADGMDVPTGQLILDVSGFPDHFIEIMGACANQPLLDQELVNADGRRLLEASNVILDNRGSTIVMTTFLKPLAQDPPTQEEIINSLPPELLVCVSG